MPDKSEFKLAGKIRETVQDAPNSLVEKALPEIQKVAPELPSPREPCSGECHVRPCVLSGHHILWGLDLGACQAARTAQPSPRELCVVPGMALCPSIGSWHSHALKTT